MHPKQCLTLNRLQKVFWLIVKKKFDRHKQVLVLSVIEILKAFDRLTLTNSAHILIELWFANLLIDLSILNSKHILKQLTEREAN